MGHVKPGGGFLGENFLLIFLIIVIIIVVIIIVYFVIKKREKKKGQEKLREHAYKGIKSREDIKSIYTPTGTSTSENEENDTMIKLENLTKYYGKHLAVDNVSIEVHSGEVIGLVGPNGAGKTTIIKMIAKLLRPSSGRIWVRDNQGELKDLNKKSRNLVKFGFLIDIPAFYKDMTAYQILKYSALLQRYPREKINDRIDELLKIFDLIDWKHEKVKTFSKGMAQKLGMIQSIIHDPEIIILDEPQTGLDPLARIDIRRMIKEFQRNGKTIFVASHMLAEISEVCDKIALINFGVIIAFDTIDNLERGLRTSGLNCKLLDPISPDQLGSIIKKLTERLEPYLDKDLDLSVSKIPIKYIPQERSFKIFYDITDSKQTRAEILKILVKEFESDFRVVSFSKPKKSSQLEQIYSKLIAKDKVEIELSKGGVN